MENVLMPLAGCLLAAAHIFTGSLFADVHQEFLRWRQSQRVEIVIGGVYGYGFFVAEVIEGLGEPSAALAASNPCEAGGAHKIVLDACFRNGSDLILFEVQDRDDLLFGWFRCRGLYLSRYGFFRS